jgi:hypothetical protein
VAALTNTAEDKGQWRLLRTRLRIRASGGSYEHGNDLSVFMKRGVFLDQLRDVWLFKVDSTSSTLKYRQRAAMVYITGLLYILSLYVMQQRSIPTFKNQ